MTRRGLDGWFVSQIRLVNSASDTTRCGRGFVKKPPSFDTLFLLVAVSLLCFSVADSRVLDHCSFSIPVRGSSNNFVFAKLSFPSYQAATTSWCFSPLEFIRLLYLSVLR